MDQEIRERLVRIEERQRIHNDQLELHMKRTALLEERQMAFLTSLKTVETRLTVVVALGAALIPLASLLLQVWNALHR